MFETLEEMIVSVHSQDFSSVVLLEAHLCLYPASAASPGWNLVKPKLLTGLAGIGNRVHSKLSMVSSIHGV